MSLSFIKFVRLNTFCLQIALNYRRQKLFCGDGVECRVPLEPPNYSTESYSGHFKNPCWRLMPCVWAIPRTVGMMRVMRCWLKLLVAGHRWTCGRMWQSCATHWNGSAPVTSRYTATNEKVCQLWVWFPPSLFLSLSCHLCLVCQLSLPLSFSLSLSPPLSLCKIKFSSSLTLLLSHAHTHTHTLSCYYSLLLLVLKRLCWCTVLSWSTWKFVWRHKGEALEVVNLINVLISLCAWRLTGLNLTCILNSVLTICSVWILWFDLYWQGDGLKLVNVFIV